MTRREYCDSTLADFKGKTYRLNTEIYTGQSRLAVGTLVVITGKRSGLNVETKTCPHCKASHRCRKVPYTFLDEVPDG